MDGLTLLFAGGVDHQDSAILMTVILIRAPDKFNGLAFVIVCWVHKPPNGERYWFADCARPAGFAAPESKSSARGVGRITAFANGR